MKTGIIRRVDDLGRVAIPRKVRRQMNINEVDPLEICIDGDKLYFEKCIISNDLTNEKTKAIQSLKDACLTLHRTEKEGEQE